MKSFLLSFKKKIVIFVELGIESIQVSSQCLRQKPQKNKAKINEGFRRLCSLETRRTIDDIASQWLIRRRKDCQSLQMTFHTRFSIVLSYTGRLRLITIFHQNGNNWSEKKTLSTVAMRLVNKQCVKPKSWVVLSNGWRVFDSLW